MNHSTALSKYITGTNHSSNPPVLLFTLLFSPSEDKARDKGNNSIGSRLNRMEDKVWFVQFQWETRSIFPRLLQFQMIYFVCERDSEIYMAMFELYSLFLTWMNMY